MEDVVCKDCATVNDYTTEQAGPHIKAVCNNCHKYIKMLPQGTEPKKLYFGKYKGRAISSMVSKDELSWIQWALKNVTSLKATERKVFIDHLTKQGIQV